MESWIERFEQKIDRRLPTECWPWKACRCRAGYGIFRLAGKNLYAHRIALELAAGRKLKLLALHKCGNTYCCNSNHLYEGTYKQNSDDRNIHGTVLKHERNPRAKLSFEQINKIRELYSSGNYSYKTLMDTYPVGKSQMSRIIREEQWAGPRGSCAE